MLNSRDAQQYLMQFTTGLRKPGEVGLTVHDVLTKEPEPPRPVSLPKRHPHALTPEQLLELQRRQHTNAQKIYVRHVPGLIERLDQLEKITGARPDDWKKPGYNNVDYWIAHRTGWISDAEAETDRAAYEHRYETSLRTGHRYKNRGKPRKFFKTKQYVPVMRQQVYKDPNLTDGARRLATWIKAETYRESRDERALLTTKVYMARAMDRCPKTIQNYLTLLERHGYIACDVVEGEETKMSFGLLIHLREPLFPAHYKKYWPKKRRKSGEKINSPKDHFREYINISTRQRVSRTVWAMRSMQGVYRSYLKSQNKPKLPYKQLNGLSSLQEIYGSLLNQETHYCIRIAPDRDPEEPMLLPITAFVDVFHRHHKSNSLQ